MTVIRTGTKSQANDRTGGTARVSLWSLYLLRFGYLVVAVGLVATKWPLIINHDRPWPLFEGVETCMLGRPDGRRTRRGLNAPYLEPTAAAGAGRWQARSPRDRMNGRDLLRDRPV